MLHGLNTLRLSRSQRGTFTSTSFSLASSTAPGHTRDGLRPSSLPPAHSLFHCGAFHAELSQGAPSWEVARRAEPESKHWARAPCHSPSCTLRKHLRRPRRMTRRGRAESSPPPSEPGKPGTV